LYEDENDNYNYEKGVYATIEFIWNDTSKELTIKDHKGEFPGMLKVRTINIVLIEGGKGTGIKITDKPDKSILYNGNKHIVQF
ncbi:MAG: DUF5110 domain-containing protein, partial [Bacteroidales bacterium]|nr:DUF5110 domain-containing protein [Bacteroidales bacterium]